MNGSIIYTVSNGQLTAMTPAAPENEDTMQRLVAEHPEIISDRDGALLLIRREQPIGDGEGDGRWSLDHLFVTREGVPVLVELKRAVDTRLRREVVGQMLDYAANATAHWKAGTIAASFEVTARAAGRDPGEMLAAFLGDEEDPEAFWQRVDDSFAAGRVKLVFVADTIPRELARIVEYLNEQMKAEVRAVELNWFEGQGIRAFTPRIIGETERALAAKSSVRRPLPALSHEEWIGQKLARHGDATVRAAKLFMEVVEAAGGHAEVARQQGSMVGVFDLPGVTIYPVSLVENGKGTLNLAYLRTRAPFDDEEQRKKVYDRFAELVGPLSTSNLVGYPAFDPVRLQQAEVGEGVIQALADIAAEVTAHHSGR